MLLQSTAGVTRWQVGELRLAVETVKTQSHEKAQKLAAYLPVHCTHCWAALLGMMLAIKKQLKPK